MSFFQTALMQNSFHEDERGLDVSSGRKQVYNSDFRQTGRANKQADTALERLNTVGGFSMIPNTLLDNLRGILERNEYDVFMYIVRRTFCFHKLSDTISMSQFQNGIVTANGKRLDFGCGLKGAETINKALKELEKRGFISRERKTAANGAATSNLYTVHPEAIIEAISKITEEHESLTETTDVSPKILPISSKLPASLELKGIPLSEEIPPSMTEEGLTRHRGDKTIAFNKNQKKIPCMGQFPLVKDFSGEDEAKKPLGNRVEIDRVLLVELGFDKVNALRLALIAEKTGKPEDYIARIIAYSNRNATSNAAGMVRRLIERGDERFGGHKKSKALSFLAQNNPSNQWRSLPLGGERANALHAVSVSDESQPISPNLSEVWAKVCQNIGGKLGKPDLANLLNEMRLDRVETGEGGWVCFVQSKQDWQTRLFTPASVAIIELMISQQLKQPGKVKFEKAADN